MHRTRFFHHAPRAVLAAALATTASATAATIQVPGDVATIQGAIAIAADGDEIVVSPGVYTESIDLLGKSLIIRSSGGAALTTIDATGQPAPAITVLGTIGVGGNCPADLTGSGTVDGADLAILLGVWGACGATCQGADFTGDGVVDGADLATLLGAWGTCPTAGGPVEIRGFTVLAGDGRTIPIDPKNPKATATFGGGLFVEAAELLVADSVIRNAFVTGRGGGARIVGGAIVAFEGVEFRDNLADRGAGMSVAGASAVSIEGGAFTNNLVPANGGALAVEGGAATIVGTRFEDNEGTANGGAIYVLAGSIAVDGAEFLGNRSVRGGAIHFNNSGVGVIRNSLFEGNTTSGASARGAVLYAISTRSADDDAEARFENCVFRNNVAGGSAGRGVVYSTTSSSPTGGGVIRIFDSVFEDNSTTSGGRGAVGYSSGGSQASSVLEIVDSTIVGATGAARGGAFFVDGGGILRLDGVSIANATASDRGGAIYALRGEVFVANSQFTNCSAAAEGGAISIRASSSGGSLLVLDGVTITGCSSLRGGGIYSNSSVTNPNTILAERLRLEGNSSVEDAGGLFAARGTVSIANSLIARNSGGIVGGAWIQSATAQLLNTTIADNDAGLFASELLGDGVAEITLANSIVWNTTSGAFLPLIFLSDSAALLARWSNVQGGEAFVDTTGLSATIWEVGNIAADPRFVDAAAGNFRLGPGSASVDAGDSQLAIGDLDLDGNPRIVNAVNYPTTGPTTPAVDQGAYEAPANLPAGR